MNLWRKLNKGCILLVAIPLLILIGLWLFAEWAWGGSIKPSLDPQYVPTAEYLLEHPQPTPSFMQINPNPGSTLGASDYVQVIIFGEDHTITQWTKLFLNNQRVSMQDADTTGIPAGLGVPEDKKIALYMGFHLNSKLNSGPHLFRLQIASTLGEFLNPDPNLSYEWAYLVE